MHQIFNVTGMTCESCTQKIKIALGSDSQIKNLNVTLKPAQIHFDSDKQYSQEELNKKLYSLEKYSVTELTHSMPAQKEDTISFIKYLPLILLFALSAGIPALNILINKTAFDIGMHQFMGATLIALAYFKLVDLPKFAEAFSTYDLISKKFYNYGYIYPFFELSAGIFFILSVKVKAFSVFTILFLIPTTIGVVKALREKRNFQCACLGTAFNLPLTSITIVENILMIIMSAMIIGN